MSISIIIPVYNVEKYLKECADSIINQTYKDFEVVLVDDGSTDSSGRICDEICLRDERFRVFHKKNEGVSIARNLGIKNARYDYIAFIDADDIISPLYLEVLGKNMVEGGICSCELTRSYSSLCKSISKSKIELEPNDAVKVMLTPPNSYIPLGPVCKLFDRRIILDNNIFYNPNYAIAEDLLFNCEYISKSKNVIIHIPLKLYYYRTSSGISINRFKKKKVSTKLLSAYNAMKEASSNFSEVEINKLFDLRACKGAADDLRLMAASNYTDNILKKKLQKHIRKNLFEFLRSDYLTSAKLSVLLSAISPKIEYFIWFVMSKIKKD